jgi:hypothetical protein
MDTTYDVVPASRRARQQRRNEGLLDTLTDMAEQAGQLLRAAVADASSLEVATYVSDNLNGVRYNVETGTFDGSIKLRALTRVSIDGDTLNCLPEEEGALDLTLWQLHNDVVQRAQANRREMLRVVLSTANNLVDRAGS